MEVIYHFEQVIDQSVQVVDRANGDADQTVQVVDRAVQVVDRANEDADQAVQVVDQAVQDAGQAVQAQTEINLRIFTPDHKAETS